MQTNNVICGHNVFFFFFLSLVLSALLFLYLSWQRQPNLNWLTSCPLFLFQPKKHMHAMPCKRCHSSKRKRKTNTRASCRNSVLARVRMQQRAYTTPRRILHSVLGFRRGSWSHSYGSISKSSFPTNASGVPDLFVEFCRTLGKLGWRMRAGIFNQRGGQHNNSAWLIYARAV